MQTITTAREIKSEIGSAMNEFRQLISSFSQEQLNKIPFKDSWTAAQVADHILLSQNGVLEVIQGKSEPAKRPPDEKKQELKDMFLNFTIKMQSPEFVLPANEPLKKDALIQRIENTAASLDKTIPGLDLSFICLDFEFPGSGPLTRIEWLYFLLYHTQRHNRQLRNIFEKV